MTNLSNNHHSIQKSLRLIFIVLLLIVPPSLKSLAQPSAQFFYSRSGSNQWTLEINPNHSGPDQFTYYHNLSTTVTAYCLYLERKDGTWEYMTSGRNFNPSDPLYVFLGVGIYNNDNYVFKYSLTEENINCDVAEIQAKYGRKPVTWVFCVAEDKASGAVFVSQGFKMSESLSYSQVYNKVLNAYKAHIKNVLKDNASLHIPYDETRLNFWIEYKTRGFSKAIGRGAHLGMNYPQIVDYSISATTEDTINKSREGFINFKNDYGNLDLVYLVDFDYNKVKN